MKTYKKPELEIARFEAVDIITTSVIEPVTADIEGATVQFQSGWEPPAVETAADLLGN